MDQKLLFAILEYLPPGGYVGVPLANVNEHSYFVGSWSNMFYPKNFTKLYFFATHKKAQAIFFRQPAISPISTNSFSAFLRPHSSSSSSSHTIHIASIFNFDISHFHSQQLSHKCLLPKPLSCILRPPLLNTRHYALFFYPQLCIEPDQICQITIVVHSNSNAFMCYWLYFLSCDSSTPIHPFSIVFMTK
jgi:hypothetical protein